jgi:replicative DNA helicase
VDQLLDEVERDILKISQERESTALRPMKELVRASITFIEQRHARGGELGGLATGLMDLDKLTDGLKAGEMFVIAARRRAARRAWRWGSRNTSPCRSASPWASSPWK